MGGFQALSKAGNEIEILNENIFHQICLQYVFYLFSKAFKLNGILSNDIVETKVPHKCLNSHNILSQFLTITNLERTSVTKNQSVTFSTLLRLNKSLFLFNYYESFVCSLFVLIYSI